MRMTQKAWGSVSGPRTPAARSWHTCCQGKHVARIQPLDRKETSQTARWRGSSPKSPLPALASFLVVLLLLGEFSPYILP